MTAFNRTPRAASPGSRQGGGDNPPCVSPARLLSFACVGGDVIWQTYPGHLVLTIEQAEAVMADVREELVRTCMAGGGPTEAVSMLAEILEAINTARRWRQAQGGL